MLPDESPSGSARFRKFMVDRGLSMQDVAEGLGKAKPQVVGWCNGTTPDPHNAEAIELYCAFIDEMTREPRRNERGEVVSHVPYESWWLPGKAPRRPKRIQPRDAAPEAS